MSDLNKIEALTKQIRDLAEELRDDKASMPLDRVQQIEEEITAKSAEIDEIQTGRRFEELENRLAEQDARIKALRTENAKTKAAAILGGVKDSTTKAYGQWSETNWMSALKASRYGDVEAQTFVKAVLGTSSTTGTAVIPNNFVTDLVAALALSNPYRGVLNVTPGIIGAGVDIPYEITAVSAALVQGAYGSSKDIRDFSFARATATLYTIAEIADVGNQLLRQSNGAAEASARRRLAQAIGMAEAQFITNGTGSGQPLGFFQAFLAYGDPAAFKTALTGGEPRVATLARAIGAMENRGVNRNNLVFYCNSTDYWELASEGLGSSYAGGWAIDPAGGASLNPPITRAWGIPLYTDPNWPAAQAGTGLLIDTTVDGTTMYTGQEYRIDVSSEANLRFDQNVTGFRAEEEFAFNAEPAVRTGRVQKVTGI